MSSDHREFNLKMVCLQATDKSKMLTYTENVSIGILLDAHRQCMYCRIRANDKVLLTIELTKLRWMPQSSAAGVATIRTMHQTVVATYDASDNALKEFFAHLQQTLAHDVDVHITRRYRCNQLAICDGCQDTPKACTSSSSASSQFRQDPPTPWIDNLIRSIHEGSSEKAECYAAHLASIKANIQFSLSDIEGESSAASNAVHDDKSHPESIFQLMLQIEGHANSNPSKVPITVRLGATLRSLKEQIAEETGIACEDQYWFASRRYPLTNEYVFGSSEPVSLAQSQMQPPVNPVRSGDTLIMYITQPRSPY